MQEGSSLLNPYDIVFEDENIYSFETQAKILYVAFFTDSSGYFNENPEFNNDMISFTFEPAGEHREVLYLGTRTSKVLNQNHDRRIMDTVITILLRSFQQNPEKSISMICEEDDQLGYCRNRYFNMCFLGIDRRFNTGVTKHDLCIEGEGYMSIFIKKENSYHDEIVAAFYDIPNRAAVNKDSGETSQ